MKTDDLVTMLATNAGAVEPHSTERRLACSMALGAIAAVALMTIVLGVRTDLVTAVALPMFWIKFGFVASLSAAALAAVLRLSRPGARLGLVGAVLALPLFMMWGLGAITLAIADPVQRLNLVFGQTWLVCPFLIAMLSAPFLVTALWAVKGLAPTNLPLAGAAAGLLAGASGALVYSIHCPEMDAPFLGTWYVLGMLVPTLAGAMCGRRILRW